MYIFIMQNYKKYTSCSIPKSGERLPFLRFLHHSTIPLYVYHKIPNISLYWILYIQYYDGLGIRGFEN